MKMYYGIDDFSPSNSGFGFLEEIKEHYPNFKVTLFTVPWEIRFGKQTPITEYIETTEGKERKWQAFIDAVKESDWIEIALHGLTHAPREFADISYDEATKRILTGEKMLQNVGISYVKLFKAPFWLLSEEGKKAAEDLGFKVLEDGYYNWNLKDERPDEDVLIGQAHIQQTMGNGLEESLHRFYTLPSDTQFHFLSEYFNYA